MIFKPELARKVLDGTKTQTRRKLPCRYQVGRWYKVQPGRGKPHVGHIHVTGRRHERLWAVRDLDAQLEGFADKEGFFAYWQRLYGKLDMETEVVVLDFVLLERLPCCAEMPKEDA